MACVATADNPTAAAIRTEAKKLIHGLSLNGRRPPRPILIDMPYWSRVKSAEIPMLAFGRFGSV
jgi:hypothetical protein